MNQMRSSFLLSIQPRAIKSRLPSSTATAVDAMVYYLRNIFRIVKSISYYLIGRTPTLRLASVSKRGLRAKSALVCKDEKGRLLFEIGRASCRGRGDSVGVAIALIRRTRHG